MRLGRWLAVLALVCLGWSVSAQDDLAPEPAIDAWEALALRAEATAEGGSASAFALNRLRDELFQWRDSFLADQDINAGRLATLNAQISALGGSSEETEPDAIAARRAALEQERDRLRIPALLAAESHARANGLIAEIDSLIRTRQTAQISQRGASPLNPQHWPDGMRALRDGIGIVVGSGLSRLVAEAQSGAIWQGLPLALVYFFIAGVLLWRGRRFAVAVNERYVNATARWKVIWAFILSLGQIILPTVGLIALLQGLDQFALLDQPGADLFSIFLSAGVVVIFARWLNAQLFPTGSNQGPLRYDAQTRSRIRSRGIALGVGVSVAIVMDGLVRLSDPSDAAIAAALAPILFVLAYLLFVLGQALRQPPTDADDPNSSGGQVRAIIGRLVMGVAVAAPVLMALGYGAAADALFLPAILTLATLGILIVLQRFVYDIYTPTQPDLADETGPLLPVLIGFALFLVSLPFLAVVWGARVEDLTEIWARFQEGISLGETRLSPSDFVRFLLVFGLGYLLTRFVQGTLRKSVLPRTKLDLGGQNAIVAGLGYVGIFLAALFAITSAGIDLSSIAIVAGALSVGIGFGLQNIVQNFVSGIILLIERPIGEGDMIEVNGQMGYVRDISVRSTRIETFDRTDVIIPNADLVSGQVTNWTRGNAVGRLILPVGVAYGTDVDKVREILLEVAQNHPMSLMDPPPQVFFVAFGASSLDFEIRVQLRDVNWKMVVLSEMNLEINARFSAAGIEIPFPQQDLWLRNPQTLRPSKTGEPDT